MNTDLHRYFRVMIKLFLHFILICLFLSASICVHLWLNFSLILTLQAFSIASAPLSFSILIFKIAVTTR